MATTSSRTLRLLSLLQNHRYWPGGELAASLEVSVRTLRRDIDRLRGLGYPVLANRGVDGGYQLEAGAAMPPLLLDDDEAVGLAVALHTASLGSVAGVAESSLRALAKLSQVMPARLRTRVDALRSTTDVSGWSSTQGAPMAPETLVTVALACRDVERVRFDYVSAAGNRTERLVEPLRLVSLTGRWYLVAYDNDRNDWRSFRMDRLTGPRRTGARFRRRELPAQDAASFVRDGIGDLRSVVEVEMIVAMSAERARAQVGRWATLEEIGPEKCRMTMKAGSLEWPVMAVGSLNAEFEVVRPPVLIELFHEWSGRFGRAGRAVNPGQYAQKRLPPTT